jgi:hypothetical protein
MTCSIRPLSRDRTDRRDHAQLRGCGHTTPSGGNAQLLGEDSRMALTVGLAASCVEAGVVVSMAPKISPQTAMQAMNRPRNINVSNFMIMSPMKEKAL